MVSLHSQVPQGTALTRPASCFFSLVLSVIGRFTLRFLTKPHFSPRTRYRFRSFADADSCGFVYFIKLYQYIIDVCWIKLF